MSQFNIQSLIDQLTGSRQEANAANEARFVEIKGLLESLMNRSGGTYDQIIQNLSNQGRSAKYAIDQQSRRASASAAQDLTNRGLGNTTITSSVNRGILSDAYRAQQNVDEQIQAQRAGALENRLGRDIQTTGMLTGAIERRNDIGPDMSMYANLLQQLAASGATGTGTAGKNRITIGPGSSSWGALGNTTGGSGGGGGSSGSSRTGVTTYTNQGLVPNGSVRNSSFSSTQAAAPAMAQEQPQYYYRPGLLGWSDARGQQFASAGDAKNAGYNYRMNGYNDYSLI